MRNLFILVNVVAMALTCTATAQDAAVPAQSRDLRNSPLAKFIGQWEGEATSRLRDGTVETSQVRETAYWKLGGTALVVEGRGSITDPDTGEQRVTHEAFGVIQYDAELDGFRFLAFRADQPLVDTPLEVLDSGAMRWSMVPGPGHLIRFTIELTETTWVEIGEYSPDGGETWINILRMELKRVERDE